MPERSSWTHRFRSTPVGVLALGALLFFLGAGMVLGGVYLLLAGFTRHWAVCVGGIALGTLCLHVALGLVLGKRWAWHVAVVLLLLLLGTSVLRALTNLPEFPFVPLAELAAEAVALWYLRRPSVRGAFH